MVLLLSTKDVIHAKSTAEWEIEEELYKSSMCTTESPIIQLLEKNLLDLASYSNMIEGVFYVLSLNNQGETTVIRLFESDCYIGFF